MQINTLSKYQEKQLSIYRDKWLAIGLSTDRINRKKAIENFMIFNRLILGNKKKPVILFMDSPETTWLATLLLYTFFKNNKDIESQVESQVGSQVRSQVDITLGANSINSTLGPRVKNFVYPYLDGQFFSSYFSFYDYCNKVLKINFQEQEKWDCYLRTSDVSLIYPFDDFVVISEKPTQIKMKNMVLHNENGMAVSYADGFGVYALNGVRVSKGIVETPAEKLDPKLLLTEQNAEIRREIIRKIGISRILQKLEAKKLDTYREYELYRIENIDIEPCHILKMVCPSTSAFYSLRTPPEITSAQEAIKWCNNGKEPKEFLIET